LAKRGNQGIERRRLQHQRRQTPPPRRWRFKINHNPCSLPRSLPATRVLPGFGLFLHRRVYVAFLFPLRVVHVPFLFSHCFFRGDFLFRHDLFKVQRDVGDEARHDDQNEALLHPESDVRDEGGVRGGFRGRGRERSRAGHTAWRVSFREGHGNRALRGGRELTGHRAARKDTSRRGGRTRGRGTARGRHQNRRGETQHGAKVRFHGTRRCAGRSAGGAVTLFLWKTRVLFGQTGSIFEANIRAIVRNATWCERRRRDDALFPNFILIR
jgi:hypothetical protein